MLEKDKKYTYEELEDIIIKASAKALQELNNKSDTEIDDPMTRMAFQMQNLMVVTVFTKILLKDDDK